MPASDTLTQRSSVPQKQRSARAATSTALLRHRTGCSRGDSQTAATYIDAGSPIFAGFSFGDQAQVREAVVLSWPPPGKQNARRIGRRELPLRRDWSHAAEAPGSGVKQSGPSAGGTEATGAGQLEPSAAESPRYRRESAHTTRAAVSASSRAGPPARSRPCSSCGTPPTGTLLDQRSCQAQQPRPRSPWAPGGLMAPRAARHDSACAPAASRDEWIDDISMPPSLRAEDGVRDRRPRPPPLSTSLRYVATIRTLTASVWPWLRWHRRSGVVGASEAQSRRASAGGQALPAEVPRPGSNG